MAYAMMGGIIVGTVLMLLFLPALNGASRTGATGTVIATLSHKRIG